MIAGGANAILTGLLLAIGSEGTLICPTHTYSFTGWEDKPVRLPHSLVHLLAHSLAHLLAHSLAHLLLHSLAHIALLAGSHSVTGWEDKPVSSHQHA